MLDSFPRTSALRASLAAMLLLFAADASAQLPSALRDGRRALSFGVLADGGAAVGFSTMLSSRTAFTLDVQADAAIGSAESTVGIDRENFQLDVMLAPGLRRYMAGRGDVASYIAGRLLFGFEGSINEMTVGATTSRTETWSPTGGGALGFGLEWFVTDAMSLRGEAAMEATYTRRTDTGPGGEDEYRENIIRAGLGQSALTLSILF